MLKPIEVFIREIPILPSFFEVASDAQKKRTFSLLNMGYNFTKFLTNASTGSAVAVFSSTKNLIVLYPDGFHDIRLDRSFDIVRGF